jgi:hypothetical protein
MPNKNILLIEPGYKNKYPPLGLMKIAQYHGIDGKKDNVTFIKGEDDKNVFTKSWDRIYVTTLFSFEWAKMEKSIDFALKIANGDTSKIFVGGIAASLMHDEFLEVKKWKGIRFIKGLLTDPPAASLQLDDFAEELYSDDLQSKPIEDLIPDYEILNQIDYNYHVFDAYFLYSTRGCIRKCKFCGVPALEGPQRDNGSLSHHVNKIAKKYGEKKDLMLMDNNVVASPRFKEIIAEIRDLGFTPGATIKRGSSVLQRRVDFNQGVDARILCKDKSFLKEMSTICIKPLRIAFDHLGVRKPYEKAIRFAEEAGLRDLSNYMLYNFHDTPDDLYQRMKLNIDLNEELGIRIFSFPMRYQPIDLKDRSHIGDNWHRFYLRSMQIILQATHGIVSGAPDYFKEAFGDNTESYKELLLWPHHYLFNRQWYKKYGGTPELEEYLQKLSKLTPNEKNELLEVLTLNPSAYKKDSISRTNKVKSIVMDHYLPLQTVDERKIWDAMRKQRKVSDDFNLPEDERVEDAGLSEKVA